MALLFSTPAGGGTGVTFIYFLKIILFKINTLNGFLLEFKTKEEDKLIVPFYF